MPDCCTDAWSPACVELAKTACSTPCDCAHSVCAEGDKLDAMCNPCVSAVCEADPFCCDASWDGLCKNEVGPICGIDCN